MRFIKVSTYPVCSLHCYNCGKTMTTIEAYADLDGFPFKDYYCKDCKEYIEQQNVEDEVRRDEHVRL